MTSFTFFAFTRYFFDRALTAAGPTNILGLNLSCSGRETSIFECESDYSALTGETLAACPSYTANKPAAVLCDQGAVQLGANVRTRTRGIPYITARCMGNANICA